MAVRTSCPRCQKRFSAPEDYLGKKIDCPKCGHRWILRSREEERRLEERERELLLEQEKDRRRLELIERAEKKSENAPDGRPYYERFQTGLQAVRNYNPNAPSRFPRLRALSDVLIFGAYVAAMLDAVGAGLTIYLKAAGVLESTAVLLLCLAGWALLGTVLFLGLKTLGEVAFLLADLGDQQYDLVRLLLDVRENTDDADAT